MIISKYKKFITVTTLFISATALSAPVINECTCKSSKTFTVKECESVNANSPSWWDWITSNTPSQLHFFQLLELIHNDDEKSVDTSNDQKIDNIANA